MLKFLFIKILYGKKFKTKRTFVVERGAVIGIKGNGKINIDGYARLFNYAELKSKGNLTVGDNFYLNKYSRVIAHKKIIIGNNVTIAQFVSILDHDHNCKLSDGNMILDGYKTAPIIVGSNVWISDKVTILKGVNIGNNVIIGANSVVNSDIPSNSIAVGSPAKVIKKIL